MRALAATDYGDVDKLQMLSLPEPTVDKGQVKVKVLAASVNPVDWKLLSGHARALMQLTFPAVLGRDAAGEVIQVGSDVTTLRVGDRVLGLAMGTFAEQVVAAENAWVRIPADLSIDDAAVVPLVGLTGVQLAEILQPKKGDLVLITGAVGGVGRAAIFEAKSKGATVWAGVRSRQKAQARTLGADSVVALDDESELSKLPPLDAIGDTVGGETIGKLLSYLKKGGTVGSVVGEPAGAKERGVTVRMFRAQPNPTQLAALAQAVAKGKLVIPIDRKLPLAQGAEGIRAARAGGIGKVVLLP